MKRLLTAGLRLRSSVSTHSTTSAQPWQGALPDSSSRIAAKVAVLGATGMLGHKMFQRLRVAFPETVASMRKRASCPPFNRIDLFQGEDIRGGVDAMDFDALTAWLSEIRPDYIINCIGVIKQRPAAQEVIPSITINSLLPHRLAAVAARWGGRVIHFSTDCVFSGNHGAYTEEDESDAHDLYGRSKFLGEVVGTNALTLRTSIIGRELLEHHSLLDWFLGQKGRRVRGFRRVIYSGVTTNYLADLVASIIANHPQLTGLYQVASELISKHDLLCLLREAYRLDVQIDPDDLEVSDRSMRSERLRGAIDYKCPPWTALVRQLAEDKTPYEEWIKQNE